MKLSDVLLDTNVASYLVKCSIDSHRYERLVRGRPRCLSAVSVAELRYGALKNNWGGSRYSALESFVEDSTIIPAGEKIASVVAVVMNRREREGRRMDWPDVWIAATAIFHQLPLVTNDRDFQGIDGLEVVTELRGLEVRERAPIRTAGAAVTAEAAMEWVRRHLAFLAASAEAV